MANGTNAPNTETTRTTRPERASARGEAGGAATTRGIKALARSTDDVPPNFNLLVVFALGLLRALLRKMSGTRRTFASASGVGAPGRRLSAFFSRARRIARRGALLAARDSGSVD